jgi:VanZ family protein
MPRKIILIVACLVLAFVVFATLSPIHLRPKTGHPSLERFAAFLILGVTYALALPRRAGLVAVCLVVGAFALEAAQRWAPARDPRLNDALVKSFGALVGVAIAWVAEVGIERWRARRDGAQRPV